MKLNKKGESNKINKTISFILCISILLNTTTTTAHADYKKETLHHKKHSISKHIHKYPKIKLQLFKPTLPNVGFDTTNHWGQNTVIKQQNDAQQATSTNNTTDNNIQLDLFSRAIYAEAGDLSDKAQQYTGSVMLNRMKKYGMTLKQVLYAPHQYECTWNGAIDKPASQQSINNAKYLMANGSVLPQNVLFQSESALGKIYDKIETEFFCFG